MTRLYHAFQDPSTYWLVMELGQGGDLLERLLSEGKAMTEQAVCSSVAVPILETLAVLHDMHIIHRDLKLEVTHLLTASLLTLQPLLIVCESLLFEETS